MKSITEVLKQEIFSQNTTCPYKFFAIVYHIAFEYESELVSLCKKMAVNPYESQLFQMPLEQDRRFETFNIIFKFAPMLQSHAAGLHFTAALLRRMDNYLAGLDTAQGVELKASVVPKIPIERLSDPNFYVPIDIEIEGGKATYIIAPKIEPIFRKWFSEKLKRDQRYFSTTLADHFLNHHTIIKNGKVSNHKVLLWGLHNNPDKRRDLNRLLENLDSLSIGLAPYDSNFNFNPIITKKNKKTVFFRYSHIAYPEKHKIRKRIENVLDSALKNRVDVLVFPELTIDHDAYTVICEWLPIHNKQNGIKLVVAGSFHKQRDEGGYVNRSTMLDWQGRIIWEHHKKSPFELTAHNIEKSANCKIIKRAFDLEDEEGIREDIHTDYPLVFVDTLIGRMSTLICLDFLLPEVSTILSRVPCDFFWVPAMTPQIEDFINKARDIYGKTRHIVSGCCASKSCCELINNVSSAHSFIQIPSRKEHIGVENLNVEKCKSSPLFIYRLDKLL